VLRLGVQGGDAGGAAPLAVQAVVVVQADHGGHLGDEGVAVGVAACGGGVGWGRWGGDRLDKRVLTVESQNSRGAVPHSRAAAACRPHNQKNQRHASTTAHGDPRTGRGLGRSAEDAGHAAHEGGLAAARVGRQADHDALLIGGLHHHGAAGGGAAGLRLRWVAVRVRGKAGVRAIDRDPCSSAPRRCAVGTAAGNFLGRCC